MILPRRKFLQFAAAGAGSILVAHTDHEGIRKEDLLNAVDLYVGLARNLLSK